MWATHTTEENYLMSQVPVNVPMFLFHRYSTISWYIDYFIMLNRDIFLVLWPQWKEQSEKVWNIYCISGMECFCFWHKHFLQCTLLLLLWVLCVSFFIVFRLLKMFYLINTFSQTFLLCSILKYKIWINVDIFEM